MYIRKSKKEEIILIKIGIVGYGNLGKGVETAVAKQSDMEVYAVFSRRDASKVETAGSKVFPTMIF